MRLNGLIFFLPGFSKFKYLLIYNNAAIIAAYKLNHKQMKKLITIALLMLITLTSNAQELLKKELLVYIPMRTYHWDRSEDTMEEYHSTEGGNIGGILIFRNYQNEKVYTEKHIGALRNSFGELSFIIQQGVGINLGNVNISFAGGIATGYEKLRYQDTWWITYNDQPKEIKQDRDTWYNSLPSFFKDNGLLPIINTSISYTKYKIKPTLVISPAYINGGIIIKLDSNK